MNRLFIIAAMLIVFFAMEISAQSVSVNPPPLGYPNYDFGEPEAYIDVTGDEMPEQVQTSGEKKSEQPLAPGVEIGEDGKKKRVSSRIEGMYANMEGDNFDLTILGYLSTDDEYEETLWGNRKNMSVVYGFGSFGSNGDMSLVGFDYTYMLTKGFLADGFTPIIFGGPTGGFNITYAEAGDYSITALSLMIGLSGGVQVLIDVGDFILSPAYSMIVKTGTSSVTIDDTTESEDVDYSSTSISFDVLHKGTGITLSGILQAAEEGDDETDTTIFRFGKSF